MMFAVDTGTRGVLPSPPMSPFLASGSGTNGVLIVLEPPDSHELETGITATGRGAYYMWTALKKAGFEREDFCVAHLSSLLDGVIEDFKTRHEQHPCILALGPEPFKAVMGLDSHDPLLKDDYIGYVHWSVKYQTWVVAADAPAMLMKGNHQLVPVLQFATQRAVEVASEGFQYDEPRYLCDPQPAQFASWVDAYLLAISNGQRPYLSFDIETPFKAKTSEEKLAREEEEDFIILRCAFAYDVNEAISVPWTAPYMASLERLFSCEQNKLVTWNGEAYDIPRVRNQMPVRGTSLDGMLAWHVLNSALPKGLGFVSPFYNRHSRMWKHLSNSQPAYYNSCDALMALRNVIGIEEDLRRAGQWDIMQRHVVDLNRILDRMSATGIGRDEVARNAAEKRLTAILNDLEAKMDAAVPAEARRSKIYTGTPAACRRLVGEALEAVAKGARLTLVERTAILPVCPGCGVKKPLKGHFKALGVKKRKKGESNPCEGLTAVKVETTVPAWAATLDWKASTVQLSNYQRVCKHRPVLDRKTKRVTFDEMAVRTLTRNYPNDPLYPLLIDHREASHTLSTYIGITQPSGRVKGGLTIGRDGRIHCEYNFNPTTLRLACSRPPMQQLPRPEGPDDIPTLVRSLVVAGPGKVLLEADFSGIEAVLVGYFARWPDGIRLARFGLHSYLASHVLKRPADLSWSDSDLKAYLKEIKKSPDVEVQKIYSACKVAAHSSAYGTSPRTMNHANPEIFPTVKYAEWLQGVYYEVAAPVKRWQLEVQMEAHKNGFLRNPFGYVHRFTHVFRNVKEGGEWVRKQGDQANEVLAFQPQSTAAGILKDAMLAAADTWLLDLLRLQVHDSLVLEVDEKDADRASADLKEIMERPVQCLPLPASWNLGTHLVIETDAKMGKNWAVCK